MRLSLFQIYIQFFILQKGVGKEFWSSGLAWENSFLRIHLKIFHLRLLEFKANSEFYFSSQIPDSILPLIGCETLRKLFFLYGIYLHAFLRIKWDNKGKVLNPVPDT